MQLFGGGDEFAKKKDIANPNLFSGSKDFTGSKWDDIPENVQKDKYLDFTAINVNWAWNGISQYIAVNKGETFTASMYVKAKAGSTVSWYINLLGDKAGYKKVDANPANKTINGTGNWQKTSITFTVTGDSGAIRPRIENDGSSSFWIAGMKLERGTNATPWCPAIQDYAMKSDLDAKLVDQNFDLNSLFEGWIKCNSDSVPQNAPTSGFSFYRNLIFNDDTVMQFAFVLNYSAAKSTVSLYTRVMATGNWQDWAKNF